MDASARRSFHIGRYHCVEALAHTPLGETFRAKVYGVAGLERQYALKQMDAGVRVDAGQRARLLDAARRYATLEHERIARLTEIHDEGEECWLVTDLARGIDLPRLVAHLKSRGEVLPVDQAVLVAVDVAEALAAAERSSVLHEGLWPSTIMVLGEGEVRVADFAIASALERPGWATDDALVSVLAYAAPERLRGASATSSSDAWSLGAIAFELATGTPLFAGATIAALGAARSQGPAWDKLPSRPGLREALARLLNDDPAQRPQSASHARELLAGLLGLEFARARQGLQALVKRALGRALTRTGSFAAVAIPSASMPTLVQDAPAAIPSDSRPRTLMGIPTQAAPPAPAPVAKPEHRAWSPPRKTTMTMPVVREEHTTLPGLGVASSPEVAAMEMAELPPEVGTSETTALRPKADGPSIDGLSVESLGLDGPTEQSMETALSFDDEVVTSPRERTEPQDEPEITIDGSAQVEVTEAFDATPEETTRVPLTTQPPPIPVSETLPPPPAADPVVDLPSLRMTAPTMTAAEPVHDASTHVPRPVAQAGVDSSDLTPLPPPRPASELATQAVLNVVSETAPTVPAPSRPIVVDTVAPVQGLTLPASDKAAPAAPSSSSWRVGLLSFVFSLGAAAVVALWVYRTPSSKPLPPVVVPAAVVETPKPVVEAPKPVEVEAPKPVEVETPKPVAAANTLSLASTPPGATAWLDGTQRGTTPVSIEASAGEHKLVLVAQGHKLVTKTIQVGADGLALDVPLESVKLGGSGEGGLKVRCHTTGELRILLDGVDTGLTCPNDLRIPAEPGSHKIGLYSPHTGETHEVDGDVNEDADHSTRIYVRY